jgi:hypothetical protein
MDMLKTITGKNGAELYKMAENGQLGRDSIKALIDEMGRLTKGSNEAAMDTLNGKISVLADSWHVFEDTLLQDKSEGLIKNIVASMSEGLDLLSRNMSASVDAKIAQRQARIKTLGSLGVVGSFFSDMLGYDINLEKNKLDTLKQLKIKQDAANKDIEINNNTAKAIKETNEWLQEVEADIAAKKEESSKKAQKESEGAAKKAIEDAKQKAEAIIKAIQSEITAQDEQLLKLMLTERAYKAHELDLLRMTEAQKTTELAKWDLIKAHEAEKKSLDAGKSAIESEIDRYKQLTLSVREYKLDKLRGQGVGASTVDVYSGLLDINDKTESQQKSADAAMQAVEAYNNHLDTTKDKLVDLSSISSAIFDGQLGGINLMIGAFNTMSKAIDDSNKSLKDLELVKSEIDIAERDKLTDAARRKNNEQYSKDLKSISDAKNKYAKDEEKLIDKRNTIALSSVRQIAGATASMFAENSKGRKVMHTLEIGLGAIEMAFKIKSLAVDAAQAVLTQGKGDPYSAFFRIAAMTAIVGGIVAAAGGVFSGSSGTLPQTTSGTGTVLGDESKESSSVNDTYQLLKDIHANEYIELQGINKGINSLQSAISKTTTKLFQGGGIIDPYVDVSTKLSNLASSAKLASGALSLGYSAYMGAAGGVAAASGLGGIGAAGAGLIGGLAGAGIGFVIGLVLDKLGITDWIMGGLFGKVTKSIVGGGISTAPTAISTVMEGGDLSAYQYATIETKKKSWFSTSRKYSEIYSALNSDVQDALNDVFKNMGQTMFSLADSLGNDLTERVNNYVIPAMRIELRGLSGEEASKKLNGVISATLDAMADTVFSDILGKYQQLGEGMLETAVRIVAEMAVVKEALARSSLSLVDDVMAVSDALVQAAGGLENFQKQFNTYYEKFHNDTEKQADLQKQLAFQLIDVNVALPVTREGYRNLIEALDMSNAKDQQRYSLLLELSGAADQYYKAIEATNRLNDEAVNNAKTNLQNAYRNEVTALNDVIKKTNDFIKSLAAFKESLKVGDLSTFTPLGKYEESRLQLFNAVSIIRQGPGAPGYDQAQSDFQNKASTFLGMSRNFYASGANYQRDYNLIMSTIELLSDKGSYNKSTAELQLDALNESVLGLITINESVLSVKDAIVALSNASVIQDLTTRTNEAKLKYDVSAAAADTAAKVLLDNQEASTGATNKLATLNALMASPAPTTWQAGQSNNAYYEQALAEFNASHIASFGIPMNRSWSADSDALNVYNTAILPRYNQLLSSELQDTTDLITTLSNNIATDIVNALNATTIANADKVVYDDLSGQLKAINGKHRNGLVNVPFDGYIAELHQNERVLTANESANYSNNKQLINSVNTAVDELKLQNKHLAANVKVLQAGFKNLIEQNKESNDNLDNISKYTRRSAVKA